MCLWRRYYVIDHAGSVWVKQVILDSWGFAQKVTDLHRIAYMKGAVKSQLQQYHRYAQQNMTSKGPF